MAGETREIQKHIKTCDDMNFYKIDSHMHFFKCTEVIADEIWFLSVIPDLGIPVGQILCVRHEDDQI